MLLYLYGKGGNLDSYNETGEYVERNETSPKKILIIILIILFLLIGSFFLIRYLFFGDSKEELLLKATKEYIIKDETKLPDLSGEYTIITLDELLENKSVKSKHKFKECNEKETLVKVFKLESGIIHYVPLLTCEDVASDDLYNDWIYGEESDIIENESDLNFLFVPKEINKEALKDLEIKDVVEKENSYQKYYVLSENQNYRYRDMSWIWEGKIRKYYPDQVTDINKVTFTSITSPSTDYPYPSDKISVTYYTANERPASCSSKSEFIVVGKSTYTSPRAIYGCYYVNPEIPALLFQTCKDAGLKELPNYKVQYTCSDNVQGEKVAKNYKCNATCSSDLKLSADRASCGKYVCPSVWTDWTKTKCTGGTSVCKTKVQTEYKWYKLVDGETEEYLSTAPYTGLTKKGEGKKTNWSQWSTTKVVATETREVEQTKLLKLKVVPNDVEKYWTPLSNVPITEAGMIQAFKEKGYKVETLEDIYNHSGITYGLVLQYRNIKEKE